MNNGSMGAWLILAIVAVVVVWTMRCYNRLVDLRNRIANAFAQIDVQLKRRHDLIPNLVETARRYLQHEQSTLQAVTEARGKALQAAADARSQPANAATIATLAGAEQTLMGHVGRLLAIAESYPELKADQTLRNLSEQLTTTENQIGFARQAYNDAVLDLNNEVQAFPQLLVARLTGFALAAPLKSTATDDERATPKVVL
jgi:LemA protein